MVPFCVPADAPNVRPQTAGAQSLRELDKLTPKIEHSRSLTELQFHFKTGAVLF